MVHLKPRRHPEQQALLAACTTSHAAPAAHLTGDHSGRPVDFDDMDLFDGMPADWRPGRAHDELGDGYGKRVMAQLRAEDKAWHDLTAARAALLVPLRHRPASGLPALLAEAEHVKNARAAACRALFEEDRRRREDIMGAAWIDAADGAQMAANAAAVVDVLTVRPGLGDDAAVAAQLTAIAATLKGSVA